MNYRKIDLSEWEKKGEGSSAESYFHKTNKKIMLKLFTGDITNFSYASREKEFSDHVGKCGVRTPKAIEVVEADGKLGVIYERIQNKVSFSRLIADNPSKLDEYCKVFVDELKKLHSKKANTKFFPSIKTVVIHSINSNKIFKRLTRMKLLKIVEEIGDGESCLHGDLHTGNLVQSNGENIWIDLGMFCYGSPWYDIGAIFYSYMHPIGRRVSTKILHLNRKQLTQFYKSFVKYYLDYPSKKEYKEFTKKARRASLLFFLYKMDEEKVKGLTLALASMIVRDLTYRW